MKIGDWIDYRVQGYGDGNGTGLVVGEMRYSKGANIVILIADEEKLGMPISTRWCRSNGKTDLPAALRYRERYEKRLPGHLKPLKYKTKATDSNVSP